MYYNKKDKSIEMSKVNLKNELAQRDFMQFVKIVEPELDFTIFHKTYYTLLDLFAKGKIKRMIVSIPPQHGKSLGSSRLLPAYLLGCNPDLKIVIASYSFALAKKFGQAVQQVIVGGQFCKIFPKTKIKGMIKNDATSVRNAEEFDCVGQSGGLRLVGRESSLTGNRVDVMILDDLYKDAMEAYSPIVRENIWDWYTSVVRTRLHNDSRELIVFTRWHEDDLIGRIAQNETVYDLKSVDDISLIEPRAWIRINFEAIKETPPTGLDVRRLGEVLWSERHSIELLIEKKNLDPKVFDALYQGRPSNKEGLLYGNFKTYQVVDSPVVKRGNYTDPADKGNDFLCSICYNLCEDGNIYITDLIYTQESMESTEPMVAQMLIDSQTECCVIESNNGGRGFSRSVVRLVGIKSRVRIFSQTQRKNKESRIISNATAVTRTIIMPQNWETKWKKFSGDVRGFLQQFAANIHDDAPDVLTAIIEYETSGNNKIEVVSFTNHK